MTHNTQQKELERLTLVAFKITMLFNGNPIGSGTAFVLQFAADRYLITNWHNVSGRNPINHKPIDSYCALPNELEVRFPYLSPAANLLYANLRIQLYEDHGNHPLLPKWYIHPVHNEAVDVIALKLPPFEELKLGGCTDYAREQYEAILLGDDPALEHEEYLMRPGMDAMVLGFPRGLEAGGLALWKRATIASEPAFDVDGLPKFYIDTATREGMSGSPVYSTFSGLKDISGRMGVWNFRKLQGVYSGRVMGHDALAAQLGIVWKLSAVSEIVEGKKLGASSFELVDKSPSLSKGGF